MTKIPDTLAELERRVREATGGDRELDADLWWKFDERASEVATGMPRPLDHSKPMPRAGVRAMAPAYTTSLDAALALCERVLPGWAWSLSGPDPETDERLACAALAGAVRMVKLDWDEAPVPDRDTHTAYAPTPALALLAAMLAALRGQNDDR